MAEITGKTGCGFIHPNLPAAIQYTQNASVRASDIAAISRKARCETVQLTHHAMHCWRRALGFFKASNRNYADLPGDVEDGQVFELPPLSHPSAIYSASVGAAALGTADAGDYSGIQMRSDHFVTGRKTFTYYDPTGALSASAVVPEIVADLGEDDAAEKESCSVTVEQLSPDEQDAYRRLLQEWRAAANSKSFAGHRVRQDGGERPMKRSRASYDGILSTNAAANPMQDAAGPDEEYDAEWALLEQAERMLTKK